MSVITQIDLSTCEQEPIRIPGSIQPHGFLLALNTSDMTILQASANLSEFVGLDAQEALNKKLGDVIGAANAMRLSETLGSRRIAAHPMHLGVIEYRSMTMDVLAHVADGLLMLEFEPVSPTARIEFQHLHPRISAFLTTLVETDDLDRICDVAAREIKEITGFGRVLVYRFDKNGNGHVVSEALDAAYHSYLHQRFPASDIPKQARDLYLANRIRLISDASYTPAPLVPVVNPLTGLPTDLGFAALRSVSPIHVQYMKNMGTAASMSISIVVKGQLWGLISCHDISPKIMSFQTRAACEQFGQILALRIESLEDAAEVHGRLELRRILVHLLAALSQGPDFVDNLASVSGDLLRFASASGAAVLFEGRLELLGTTPNEQEIWDLVQWLKVHAPGDIFHTNCLSRDYPQGLAIKSCASGVMALSISQIHQHYILWFRPEFVQTIEWAGNPTLKAMHTDDAGHLTPRKSFDIWRETVVDTSTEWTVSEIDIALEFRNAILGIVLQRAEQMAQLADELGRANKELESFSYSVSHDLRAPMRHIVGFADLLLEFEAPHLSERAGRFLRNIKDSARFAGKLVDDLLSFSQMGRAALRVQQVDMNELVTSTIQQLEQELKGREVQWQIAPLPTICADPAFLMLALYNLFSNAIKYSRDRSPAVIEVDYQETDTEHVFHVRDNGVGFSMEYVHKLFGVFQRLHRMEEFEGTGIGLANVRRIVERHGGRVWAHGVLNEGAEFSFSIPKQIPLNDSDKHAETNTPR